MRLVLVAAAASALGGCGTNGTASHLEPLSKCINLAVPFTGSRSLTNLLGPYSPYAHHDHRITMALLASAPDFARGAEIGAPRSSWLSAFRSRGALEAPACYVVTVCDPAARFRTGINQ